MIKNYLSKRKLRPIGTQEITWTANGAVTDSCSVTFFINDLNKRKVKFDYGKPITIDAIKRHTWYHGAIVPFLNKTGWAVYGAAYTEKLLVEYFYKIDVEDHFRAQKSPLIQDDKMDNVILFPSKS